MKIYISGQISGLPIEVARRNFERAEQCLRIMGHEVVNPMKLHPVLHGNYARYMAVDIVALWDCDAIFMLSNWQQSGGAKIEREIAILKKMQVVNAPASLYCESHVAANNYRVARLQFFKNIIATAVALTSLNR